MNVYDLDPDFPNYKDVKIGDVFVWYMGNPNKVTEEGKLKVHSHWFKIIYKNPRYAEIDACMIKCEDATGHHHCGGYKCGDTYTIGWSKLSSSQNYTRWLRNAGAKVLFGVKDAQKND